ncbi:unnamed protein product [Polarella glacialis]|uniref:Ion transport domain-containing protein n=2 Tax=Polarella glacialis TaxID=89957 RepID=A0A813FEU4_POLGL|nr:unnamed protein product [Polarella glacialis]
MIGRCAIAANSGGDEEEHNNPKGRHGHGDRELPLPVETVRAPREPWMVPAAYYIPRKAVLRCLDFLDSQDHPDKPGMLYRRTLELMASRLDEIFLSSQVKESKLQQRNSEILAIMDHLERHTRRRRGEAAVQAGLLEYEQTSRVYDLFKLKLNLSERIMFTLDFSVRSTILSRISAFILCFTIVLSISSWMVSTIPSMRYLREGCVSLDVGNCQPRPFESFDIIESFCVYIFTLEYLLRVILVFQVRFELLDDSFVMVAMTNNWQPAITRTRSGRPSVFKSASSMSSLLRKAKSDGPKRQLERTSRRMLKHILSPSNLIDLFAIAPFWIEVISGEDTQGGALVALRMLRLTRIFRVFKLGRYSDAFTLFIRVMELSAPALSLMCFFIFLGCGLFGTLIWFAEGGEWYPAGNPELMKVGIVGRGAYLRDSGIPWSAPGDVVIVREETPFQSIVHAFWFVIVTITTVGYGDTAPTTVAGKLIGAVMILCGVIVLAMPIGVVGANFSREYYTIQDERRKRKLMKQQNDLLAKVEEEQDAQLRKEDEEETTDAPDELAGAECSRMTQGRSRLIASAEMMNTAFEKDLDERSYLAISTDLRRLLSKLIATEVAKVSPDAEVLEVQVTGVKAFISPLILQELDVLQPRIFW